MRIRTDFRLIQFVVLFLVISGALFVMALMIVGQRREMRIVQRRLSKLEVNAEQARKRAFAERFFQVLAEKLPKGFKVATVVVQDPGSSGKQFLYPGCKADITAEYKSQDGQMQESLTATALQGLTVLATADDPNSSDDLLLYLLVRPDQAKALAEARETTKMSMTLLDPFARSAQLELPIR